MSAGLAVAEKLLGKEEAQRLVLDRPRAILQNLHPQMVPPLPQIASKKSLWHRLFGRT
jgi:hypothetical protein